MPGTNGWFRPGGFICTFCTFCMLLVIVIVFVIGGGGGVVTLLVLDSLTVSKFSGLSKNCTKTLSLSSTGRKDM